MGRSEGKWLQAEASHGHPFLWGGLVAIGVGVGLWQVSPNSPLYSRHLGWVGVALMILGGWAIIFDLWAWMDRWRESKRAKALKVAEEQREEAQREADIEKAIREAEEVAAKLSAWKADSLAAYNRSYGPEFWGLWKQLVHLSRCGQAVEKGSTATAQDYDDARAQVARYLELAEKLPEHSHRGESTHYVGLLRDRDLRTINPHDLTTYAANTGVWFRSRNIERRQLGKSAGLSDAEIEQPLAELRQWAEKQSILVSTLDA